MKQNSKMRQIRDKGQSQGGPEAATGLSAPQQPLLAQKQREFIHLEAQIPFKRGERLPQGGWDQPSPASGGARQPVPAVHPPPACLSAPRTTAFPAKPPSNDKSTIHQQYEHPPRAEKATRTAKPPPRHAGHPPPRNLEESSHSSPPQKMDKQQAKQAKRTLKQRRQGEAEGESSRIAPAGEGCRKDGQSAELLQIVGRLYPFYLLNGHIAYPIEDSLLPLPHPKLHHARAACLQKLDRSFPLELQLWNTIAEYPAFFATDEDLTVEQLSAMLKHPQAVGRLFKSFHNFYLNDVLVHRYEEGAGEDYHSFVSLWRYAEENAFLDKLFHSSWNKFMLLYVSHHGRACHTEQLRTAYNSLEEQLRRQLQTGEFQTPCNYLSLLQYLVFLNDMSFETQTFKALINNKMLFFRDNNKLKNELLEQKKTIENRLAAIKDAEKTLAKREKTAVKGLKKEQKARNHEGVAAIRAELEAIEAERQEQLARRAVDINSISEIDNKTYELCCLPEFSNVWLLGEDRERNLYWFIKEQDSAIYRESRPTGEWSSIRHASIDLFHDTLDVQGIRERKLHDKINYYKQLGYIRTDQQPLPQELSPEGDSSPAAETSPHKPSQQQPLVLAYDGAQFEKFSYMQVRRVTPTVIKMMILKSEWMMTKYLYERNSKWHTDDQRNEYITRILQHDLVDLPNLTHELRTFNEKICVVEINIRPTDDAPDLKTRKIQTKIWGINEKYKHFWYDYSRKCHSLSDLHFLVSVLYLTIEKYVTKTRKPNNTKYFYKTLEFNEQPNQEHPEQEHQEQQEQQEQQQNPHQQDSACDGCQHAGELHNCPDCEHMLHEHCLSRHQQEDCGNRDTYRSVSPLI